ncbi:hypothetical protein TSMG0027 [Halocynthia phage JM-2012]|uniref:hypothetical protein n=1 Tax=Halocynthia phage JM-2012 TaxID=1173297 RepID=UPI00025C68EA|nr:hypothetical protein TSMG0027 [Halocynthia phage JM-2012]AFI55310.1 hypothetical protein TSMG0027 [Halocynthia phage JM-2012]
MELQERFEVFNGVELLNNNNEAVVRVHGDTSTIQLAEVGVVITEWGKEEIYLTHLESSRLCSAVRGTTGFLAQESSSGGLYITHERLKGELFFNTVRGTLSWSKAGSTTTVDMYLRP